MRSGSLSEREAREVAGRPACELAISSSVRASISKGDLFWTGSRAGMMCYRLYIYNNASKKICPDKLFLRFQKLTRGSGFLTAGDKFGLGQVVNFRQSPVLPAVLGLRRID